jgi:hypothetical protein
METLAYVLIIYILHLLVKCNKILQKCAIRASRCYSIFTQYMSLKIHSFIHSVVSLTTGPKPLPKRALHIVRSRAFSFKWEYPLLSLRSSSSFLRLIPSLPVTSISPFIFPSITCCRRQFLRKMWPVFKITQQIVRTLRNFNPLLRKEMSFLFYTTM